MEQPTSKPTTGLTQSGRQLVDPFVAVRPRSSHPSAHPASHPAVEKPAAKPPATPSSVPNIDGILPKATRSAQPVTPAKTPAYRPPAGPLHVQYLPKTTPVARPIHNAKPIHDDIAPAHLAKPAAKPAKVDEPDEVAVPAARQKFSWEGRKAERSLPVGRLIIGLVIGGLALFSLELGELALAVYAIVAIWKGWPSQQTFVLALAMFGGIIVASLFEQYRYVAENLAVYAFLLLCIGTVSLALEVRRDMRAKHS